MRCVGIYDQEQALRLAFWTNQWALPAPTTAEINRQRWQIELFFRWIKHSQQPPPPRSRDVRQFRPRRMECIFICQAQFRHHPVHGCDGATHTKLHSNV